MEKLESLKLFKDLQFASNNYRKIEIENDVNELEENAKLNSLIIHYKSKINDIRKRSHLISSDARNEIKNLNSQDISKVLIDLNTFCYQKYNSLKSNDIKSLSFKSIMFTTIDELLLINKSIGDKEYITDRDTYFYIYEKVIINAFMTFLALKDMNIENNLIVGLSQSIFAQLKVLSIISI